MAVYLRKCNFWKISWLAFRVSQSNFGQKIITLKYDYIARKISLNCWGILFKLWNFLLYFFFFFVERGCNLYSQILGGNSNKYIHLFIKRKRKIILLVPRMRIFPYFRDMCCEKRILNFNFILPNSMSYVDISLWLQ